MKTKIFILLFLLFFLKISSSQFWIQYPSFIFGGQVWDVIVLSNGYIIAAHDAGIYRSIDNGNSWVKVYTTPMDVVCLALNKTNGYIYAGINTSGSQYGGVYRSIDNGTSWSLMGLTGNRIEDLLVAQNGFVFAPSHNPALTSYLFRSTDNGSTWNTSYSEGTVCIATDNNNNLLCGTDDPGPSGDAMIMKSTNNGTSWTALHTFTGISTYIRGLCILNNNYILAFLVDKIYLSTDNGITWNVVYTGIIYYEKITFAKKYNHVFCNSYGGGVFHSTNYGLNWFTENSGLTNMNINIVRFDYLNKYIHAGGNHSIFKSVDSIIVTGLIKNISIVPENYKLSQNYPNPFNPTTNIKFDLPNDANTKLIIFDLLGREVAKLVNGELKAGRYQVEWDGSSYASGTYFYKIQAGDFVETKMLDLIK